MSLDAATVARLRAEHRVDPDAADPDEGPDNVHALCEGVGITYRQWDYWCRRGWVFEADRDNPGQRSRSDLATPGSGYARSLRRIEHEHLRRMAALVNAGMAPARAAHMAWEPTEAEQVAASAALDLAWRDRGECA